MPHKTLCVALLLPLLAFADDAKPLSDAESRRLDTLARELNVTTTDRSQIFSHSSRSRQQTDRRRDRTIREYAGLRARQLHHAQSPLTVREQARHTELEILIRDAKQRAMTEPMENRSDTIRRTRTATPLHRLEREYRRLDSQLRKGDKKH